MNNCFGKCRKESGDSRPSTKRGKNGNMACQGGTIFFFHDVGDNGDKWRVRLQGLFPDKDIKVFCPTASEMPVALFNGLCMNSWFNLGKDRELQDGEIWDVKKSAKFVKYLIDLELLNGTALDRIILGGHSQGGALALYAGLTYENKDTEQNLGGIFTLGSWLLLRWEFDAVYARSILSKNAPSNVLMCHGERDRKVPVDWGEAARSDLDKLVVNLNFISYKQQGHEVSAAQLSDCEKFCRHILHKN